MDDELSMLNKLRQMAAALKSRDKYSAPPTYLEISMALESKPFTGIGAACSDEITIEVGKACAQFEGIQDEIVLLFDQLCGARLHEYSRMGRIIGATSSFNVKIDLVTEAAKSFLEDERQQAAVLGWIRLCKKAAEIRNKIAHGTPTNLHHVLDGASKQGFFLAPSIYDTRKNQFIRTGKFGNSSQYCWNSYQLQGYVTAFFMLKAMLQTLREELAGASEDPMPQVLDPDTMSKRK